MSKIFIDRPIFAWVIAIIIMLAGIASITQLPIAQYPDVAPPQININASYPGASAETLQSSVTQIQEPMGTDNTLEVEALLRNVRSSMDRAANLGKNISPEVMVIAANLDDPARLTDLAASNLDLKLEEAQQILETIDPVEALDALSHR